jgi:hypothetical protein
MLKEYIAYLKDNPQGLWFKRKLYGWGWTPATWQGWVVMAIGLAIVFAGVYVGELDDAPGAAGLGGVLGIGFIIFFCIRKGEKPRWQWGVPKKDVGQ